MADASPWPCAPLGAALRGRQASPLLRQGAHGGCAGERWGKARVSVAGPVRGPLGPWQCSRGVPCLRVLRFTIWVAQLCCRVRVGVRRPGRGSWGTGQACTLPCVHFHVCVSGNPCGGRPSTCWTRDAAGCLQLARRPPRARRPRARAGVQSTDRTCLPRRAWHLWTAFECFHAPSGE